MSFDAPRNYLVVTAGDRLEAAEAVRSWPEGPPDLCVTSPSDQARGTSAFVTAGHAVTTMHEPLPAHRRLTESVDDFRDRLATALRIVSAYDTRVALLESEVPLP